MNKLFSILVFIAAFAGLNAQITVTNAIFPAAGDTLKTATDNSPTGVTITSAGGPYTWAFTELTADTSEVTVFRPASEGTHFSSFPNAELVVFGLADIENYYDVNTTTFNNLGFSGTNAFIGLPIETDFKFNPPLPEIHAPFTLFSIYQQPTPSKVSVSIATSALPGGILDSLGIPTGFLDSIRVSLHTQYFDIGDAFGTLAIPGGTYDVVRQKRTSYSGIGLEVHTILGWIDIATLGIDLGLGTDTTVTYSYLSATEKEPIAVVTMDSTQSYAVSVVYKNNGVPSATSDVTAAKPVISVSPNPATAEALFSIENINPGQYSVRLMDAQGKVVLTQQLTSGDTTVHLSDIPGGNYFYQVTDEKNKTLGAGKLLIIND